MWLSQKGAWKRGKCLSLFGHVCYFQTINLERDKDCFNNFIIDISE